MVGERNVKRVYKNDGTQIELTITCVMCGVEQDPFTVVYSDWSNWLGGKLIQEALSYLTDEQRELIKTGICGPCWDWALERLSRG